MATVTRWSNARDGAKCKIIGELSQTETSVNCCQAESLNQTRCFTGERGSVVCLGHGAAMHLVVKSPSRQLELGLTALGDRVVKSARSRFFGRVAFPGRLPIASPARDERVGGEFRHYPLPAFVMSRHCALAGTY